MAHSCTQPSHGPARPPTLRPGHQPQPSHSPCLGPACAAQLRPRSLLHARPRNPSIMRAQPPPPARACPVCSQPHLATLGRRSPAARMRAPTRRCHASHPPLPSGPHRTTLTPVQLPLSSSPRCARPTHPCLPPTTGSILQRPRHARSRSCQPPALFSPTHAPRPICSPTRAQCPLHRFPRSLRGHAVMRASGRR
jgi:hypothetical protein